MQMHRNGKYSGVDENVIVERRDISGYCGNIYPTMKPLSERGLTSPGLADGNVTEDAESTSLCRGCFGSQIGFSAV